MTLGGVNAAGKLIRKAVDPRAQIFFGMSVDHTLEGTVKLTMIATGLKEDNWMRALTDPGAITKGVRSLIPGAEPKKKGFAGLRGKVA